MKKILSTLTILALIFSVSCSSRDDSSSTEMSNTTTTVETNTWVKLTATTSANVNKSNYIIMMFDQPVTNTAALPPILKQVTTDANGLGYLDLNSIITSTTLKTYYFEAFVQNGSNYTLKSITHPTFNISKGKMITSSIIVN
ncbi:hypothetical protein [Frigoriflavimonas asaccharolytica]|uniref:Lipoprotein n=1 Tax=Frigoriflavimonas asaccharolytica TaxID=2735899 RepID=A0A8J8G9B1_9FLAO|nr:hypothetical protein [Frigoriflavimonas asaccharolytica]NRS93050.1 hypothetical protein [Frigoriflavimonas asaccharolytica]